MHLPIVAVLPLAFLATACRPAPARPDFSGTWRFNRARSALQSPAPDSLIFVIAHREPQFHLSNTHYNGANRDTFAIELTTDSVEAERSYEGYRMRSRAYWDGDVLVWAATVTLLIEGGPIRNVARYSLADDGRTLIANEHQESGQLSHDNRWVFEKRR
jgi:hypothetical protein